LILFILLSIIALYLYLKKKGDIWRKGGLSLPKEDRFREERVPLGAMEGEEYEVEEDGKRYPPRRGSRSKGKGKAREEEDGRGQTVFALGDEDA
jgi:hypothetical protein